MKKKFLTLTLLAPLYISSAFAAEAVMDAEENKTLLGSDHVVINTHNIF